MRRMRDEEMELSRRFHDRGGVEPEYGLAAGPVEGSSVNGYGVSGDSTNSYGVFGSSYHAAGVRGVSVNRPEGIGVSGYAPFGIGVHGQSVDRIGVLGISSNHTGVVGQSTRGAGVAGVSAEFEGLHAETRSGWAAAIAAINQNYDSNGAAIYAEKKGAVGHAGYFVGDVKVTRYLYARLVPTGADCAEDFDVTDATAVEPGAVLVVGGDGRLCQCSEPYDKRVVGVVSGAGGYEPGIVLDEQPRRRNRKPIALLGKVYCKVDANYAPIDVGDLLTTSGTLGHAMKTTDAKKAFGSVIGKSLGALTEGVGLIPILVALQ
jgi:hypothetical protein